MRVATLDGTDDASVSATGPAGAALDAGAIVRTDETVAGSLFPVSAG